jgi:hypothetical protein
VVHGSKTKTIWSDKRVLWAHVLALPVPCARDASADNLRNQLPKRVTETTGLVTNNLAEDHHSVNLFWNQRIFWEDGVRVRRTEDHGFRMHQSPEVQRLHNLVFKSQTSSSVFYAVD